ncbi:hypothetical protein BKA82DRAFT_889426 [Pisolithus tinctorius]|nr:hypothetical protein BKA82DRAFT_889426 [Pisolithus tinctorius]
MSAIDSSVPQYNGIAIASKLIILYSTDALFFQATLISLWGMTRMAVYSILALPDLSPSALSSYNIYYYICFFMSLP